MESRCTQQADPLAPPPEQDADKDQEEEARVEAAYIGVGCNRTSGAASWGPSGLYAYGAHAAIAILDPRPPGTLVTTLPGHRAAVTCVDWLPRSSSSSSEELHFLVSGGADGGLLVWAYAPASRAWRRAAHLPAAHAKAVTCVRGLGTLLASGSSDGLVRLWGVDAAAGGGLAERGSVRVPGARAVVALAVARLRQGQQEADSAAVVLAVAGLDNLVHLCVGAGAADGTGFSPACELRGHQDWVRGLDFYEPPEQPEGQQQQCEEQGAALYLASCSQDRSIRVWKIAPRDRPSGGSAAGGRSRSLKSYIEGPAFAAGGTAYQTSVESVLTGHEDWVYSVRWKPAAGSDGAGMCVLSASMDRTMTMWAPSSSAGGGGVWVDEVSVGELEHSAVGFYGGAWSPAGDAVMAHAHAGSLHLWERVRTDGGGGQEQWRPRAVAAGHFAPVVDVAWAAHAGAPFLVSASLDQTTRAVAPWRRKENGRLASSWHEIARPQVHGHALACVAVLPGGEGYVSGAEEKVARVFDAPGAFLDTLAAMAGVRGSGGGGGGAKPSSTAAPRAVGANMSALGLSQKPIYVHAGAGGPEHDTTTNSTDSLDTLPPLPAAAPAAVAEPPLEEHLAHHTLWPESHKLYGHGNEVYAAACSRSGGLLATACKAAALEHAEIWLWDTGTWRAVGRVRAHVLTVTQMEFSPDDAWLLSVSRDRHFCLSSSSSSSSSSPSSQQQQQQQPSGYEVRHRREAHKRVIWACGWSPCGRVFATGSRDKAVKLWGVPAAAAAAAGQQDQDQQAHKVELVATLAAFKSSVTSLAWTRSHQLQAKEVVGVDYALAVGLESGVLQLWRVTGTDASGDGGTTSLSLDVRLVMQFQEQLCHVAAVHRLCWRETEEEGEEEEEEEAGLQLASCGADHAVRIFNVRLSKRGRQRQAR